MERPEGLGSSSRVDVTTFSALHISENAFWDGAHQSLPLHFRNHLLERHLFKKQNNRNEVQSGDLFHSTTTYNILVKPDVSIIVVLN